MIDIPKKLMALRDEADALYKSSKNMSKDAASLYAAADKVWASKQLAESIRASFLRLGPIALEPDIINGVIDDCLASLVESGSLGA